MLITTSADIPNHGQEIATAERAEGQHPATQNLHPNPSSSSPPHSSFHFRPIFEPGLPELSARDAPPIPQIGAEDMEHQGSAQSRLGSNTAFWEAYNRASDTEDKEVVKFSGGYLDSLLIFAGLFAAINAAFIIEGYKCLEINPADETNRLLRFILISMQNNSSSAITFDATPRSGRDVRTNSGFFLSLCFSLSIAFGVVFAKQWVAQYDAEVARSSKPSWKVGGRDYSTLPNVLATLPILHQTSVFFFLVGLVNFSWSLNDLVAFAIVSFTTFTFLLTTSLLPAVASPPIKRHFFVLLQRIRSRSFNNRPKASRIACRVAPNGYLRWWRRVMYAEYILPIFSSCSRMMKGLKMWRHINVTPSLPPPLSYRKNLPFSHVDISLTDNARKVWLLSGGDANLVELDSTVPISLGGSCDLFTGIHKPTKLKLALKSPRFTASTAVDIFKRFKREATAWSRFDHLNLLPFLGVIEKGSRLYLVSPFLSRGDLLSFVQDRSKISSGLFEGSTSMQDLSPYLRFNEVQAVWDIAAGLEYLHSLKVVHGDLKARNVLLSDDNRAQICDFGLSKVMDHAVLSSEISNTGYVRWQSPELFFNQPKTCSSDVYAFGMTIVEVLTGTVPFPHLKTQSAIVKAVALGNERPTFDPLSHSGVDYQPLWRIAVKCWAAHSAERPTMKDILDELQQVSQ